MSKFNGLVLAAAAVLGAGAANGSGFALYEASTKGHALGGAVVGKAVDASANFYNPATLSDLTNIEVTVGFVTQHPRARMKVDGEASTAMNPGCFWLPHFMAAVPLPWDFTFGLSCMPEYGLGSSYDNDWELVNSSQETTVQSFTLSPNLSYAITDRWSVGAGFRLLCFDFEQYSDPMPGYVSNRLKGDNRMKDWGWQAGTRYKIFDNFAVGALYKSMIKVNVEGKSETDGLLHSTKHAETELDLPQAISGGFNWDITDTVHLGAAMTWTQWSSVDQLDFMLGEGHTIKEFNWEDTYRYSIAPSWDFAENWTWMGSYAYETDCTGDQDSTMLPAAERHMLAMGFAWRCWKGLELALSYGLIIMDGSCGSQATDYKGVKRQYDAYRGIAHSVGFSLTYRF